MVGSIKAEPLKHMNDDKRANLIRSRMQKQMKKKRSINGVQT